MVPATTSPGKAASPHGVQLVVEDCLTRFVCLFIVFVEEIREIFIVAAYIHCIPFLGLVITLAWV
jgi:hypothetical protein